jgi:hypothetical protein
LNTKDKNKNFIKKIEVPGKPIVIKVIANDKYHILGELNHKLPIYQISLVLYLLLIQSTIKNSDVVENE